MSTTNNKMAEYVLCFPSALFDELGRFQGICTDVGRYFPRIVTRPNCMYVLRERAEEDPQYKQVIPYVLFAYGDSLFSYRRGKRGSEGRLREKYSVGIGGHIEEERDSTPLLAQADADYEAAMWREVDEEVNVTQQRTETCVALLNDDSNEVGQVHFGVVHLVRLGEPEIAKDESVITDAALRPISDILADREKYETWSQLCLDEIEALLAPTASTSPLDPNV